MKGFIKYLIAAVSVIVLSVVFYINTFKLKPAGYLLPRILIVIIILLSIAMLIEAYRAEKKKVKDEGKSNGVSEINHTRAVVFALLIFGYIVTIKPLGYFIVTPFFVIISYLYLKATKIRNILLIALGFTAFVYLLFIVFLKLPIPLGPMS